LPKRIVVGIVSALLLIGVFSLAFNIQPAQSEAHTITVPDDYPTIQSAIDAANAGDTIFVRNGSYQQNLNLNKAVALVGESRESTSIWGWPRWAWDQGAVAVTVSADGASITNFTIFAGHSEVWAALFLSNVTEVNISGNTIWGSDSHCVLISSSSFNTFLDNNIEICELWASSSNNLFFGNNVWYQIMIDGSSFNNTLYGNIINAASTSSINNWNATYPLGGNYWGGGYTGVDLKKGPNQDQPGHDGIGDTAYAINANNTDYYPLMKPYVQFSAGAPYAHFNYTPNRLAGENVTFDASDSYDVNGTIVNYAWDFGDGVTAMSASPVVNHAYGNVHSNTVKLTVTDNDGLTDTSTQAVTVGMVPTSISISTSPSSMFAGFRVNVTGMLRNVYGYGLIGETVVLSYSFSGISIWTPITSCITDNNGNYAAMWIPTATGAFTLNASWSGTSTVSPANSTTTLNCLSYDQYVFSVESNSTISNLVYNAAGQTLSFTATGPDGTAGYVRATVTKNLTANPAGVKVLIDGNQVGCSPTSTSDACLIYFTYQHSTHNVIIDLSAATQPTPTPTPSPTATPTPTPTSTSSPTSQPTSTPTSTPNPTSTPQSGENPFANWMLYLIPVALAAIIIVLFFAWKRKKRHEQQTV
jgi:cell division septation protein DedD